MTAPAVPLRGLSDEARKAEIAALARNAAWKPHAAVMAALAMRAHPSLSPARRAYLFADYCDTSGNAVALEAGVAEWDEFWCETDFCGYGGDPHDRALELLRDRAAEAMFALVNGECER